MSLDIDAARQFIHANRRLIERHRLATMIDGAPPWRDQATEWCWNQLEGDEAANGYTIKFATDFSRRPGLPSRALFTDEQIEVDLDRLQAGQREDGGWTVEYLPWCPGPALEWRGIATILALDVLRANGRASDS